jgi:hypothetical protein
MKTKKNKIIINNNKKKIKKKIIELIGSIRIAEWES